MSGTISLSHVASLKPDICKNGALHMCSPSHMLAVVLSPGATLVPDNTALDQHCVLLLPPSTEYSVVSRDSEVPVHVYAVDICFTVSNVDSAYLLPDKPCPLSNETASHLQDSIREICHIDSADADLAHTARRLALGYSIISSLCKELQLDAKVSSMQHKDRHLQNILSYIKANYAKHLSVNDIAEGCQVSASLLFMLTKRIDNSTPMQLLRKVRLQESLRLLRDSELNIAQVAIAVGYSDANHFSRAFKKEFGMTARQYNQTNNMGIESGALFEKAEALLEKQEYTRALSHYKRLIKAVPNWKGIDEVYYKAGLASDKLGEKIACAEYWHNITSLHYQLLIRLHQCANRNNPSRDILVDELRDIYRDGNPHIREQVASLAASLMDKHAWPRTS